MSYSRTWYLAGPATTPIGRQLEYLAMSFGYGVGDIIAVSRLALKVYSAYKDAPDDYRSEERRVGKECVP